MHPLIFCFVLIFLVSYVAVESILLSNSSIVSAMQNNCNSQELAPITLKWDPKNLEIKTKSVERTLEPLVIQVKPFSLSTFYAKSAYSLKGTNDKLH